MLSKEIFCAVSISLCILYVFVLTFKSSKNQAMKIKNTISEEEFLNRKNDITKKNIITLVILIILTIISYI